MTKEEYLKERIKYLEKFVTDNSIDLKIRKNQALALVNYKLDLERELKNH